jgi:hypothetical protein
MPVTIIGQKSQAKTQGLKLWQNGQAVISWVPGLH